MVTMTSHKRHGLEWIVPRFTIRPRPITRRYEAVGIRTTPDITLVDLISPEDR